jgi:hypothetical protein
MTKGLGRFEFYLIQLDDLLLKASRTNNPALFLYQNDTRTKVFMLEGLAKLYAGLHNEKKFLKIKERFKEIEDLIGGIDYYDNFEKDFSKDKGMPASNTKFLQKKREEKLDELNAILVKRKWINHEPLRTIKIRKKLKKMDWVSAEIEIELIKKFYLKSIASINKFYEETGTSFTNIEEQIHELRRRLRWLSIYPQALQGVIQLKDSKIKDEAVKKYLIPEIVNSPFNKMPAKGNNTTTLLLEKNYFLALSYMIAALGKLKDKGLRVVATTEAVKGANPLSEAVALNKALQLNKMKADGVKTIMNNAKKLCVRFFKENNLGKIIVG